MFSVFVSIPDWYKTQEIIYEDTFMLIDCPDRNKNQTMCNEAVDDCLEALKLISVWSVKSKMLEKVHGNLLTNDEILF